MRFRRTTHTQQHRSRRATACAELALSVPILVSIAFGTIELCQLINLKQSLGLAAYEAGRLAIRRDGTAALVTAKAQSICAARGIANPTIQIIPAGLAGVTTGTQVQVIVSANWQNNNVSPIVLSTTLVLTGTMTLIAE